MGYYFKSTPAPTTSPTTASPTFTPTTSPTAAPNSAKASSWSSSYNANNGAAANIMSEFAAEERELSHMPLVMMLLVGLVLGMAYLIKPRRRKGGNKRGSAMVANETWAESYSDWESGVGSGGEQYSQNKDQDRYDEATSLVHSARSPPRRRIMSYRASKSAGGDVGTVRERTQEASRPYDPYAYHDQEHGPSGSSRQVANPAAAAPSEVSLVESGFVGGGFPSGTTFSYKGSTRTVKRQSSPYKRLDVKGGGSGRSFYDIPEEDEQDEAQENANESTGSDGAAKNPLHLQPVNLSSMSSQLQSPMGLRLYAHGAQTKTARRISLRLFQHGITWQTEITHPITGDVMRGTLHTIHLATIQSITTGKVTAALQRVELTGVEEGLCLSLQTSDGSLDLQANTEVERDGVVDCLRKALERYRRTTTDGSRSNAAPVGGGQSPISETTGTSSSSSGFGGISFEPFQ